MRRPCGALLGRREYLIYENPQLARFRSAVRLALVGYTALTIALYVLDNTGMTIGYVDKAIEVALVTLLLADAYRARLEPSGEAPEAGTIGQ